MSGKNFRYYQPNRKDIKDDYGDCVIRCLTKVLNKDWVDIFDELVPYAREMQCMPNGKPCYEKYLKDHGFSYVGISNKKGTKRPTVKSFSGRHKNGTYVLRVAHHLVACENGLYFDTWDSGEKSLYGYWEKPQTESEHVPVLK